MCLYCSLQVHISISQYGDKDSVYNAVPQGVTEGGGSCIAYETPLPSNLSAENQHSWKWLQKYDESPAFTDRNYQVRLHQNEHAQKNCFIREPVLFQIFWK